MAELAAARAVGEVTWIDPRKADPREVMVYRSVFDALGFCDLKPINSSRGDSFTKHREAYRRLWLDDLGGFSAEREVSARSAGSLKLLDDGGLEGLREIAECAQRGNQLIQQLKRAIIDPHAPASSLRQLSANLSELDRSIEELGFQFTPFGSLTRMFVFGKENMSGTDPLSLASQMDSVYGDLGRWCQKFERYYQQVEV
jgi:hypothetical protein